MNFLKNLFLLLLLSTTSSVLHAGSPGWVSLLDEERGPLFRGFKSDTLPDNWSMEGDILKADGGNRDIVTLDQYEHFELELEYRLEKGGNSGVFFFVKEHEIFDKVWRSGIEFQVIDNANSEFAQRSPKNQAGSVFALYAATADHTHPYGEWNRVKIRVLNAQVEYWMNGYKVLEFTVGSDAWYADREETLHNAGRKPFWGEFRRGHIALQDEGFPVAYRDIRIRKLHP